MMKIADTEVQQRSQLSTGGEFRGRGQAAGATFIVDSVMRSFLATAPARSAAGTPFGRTTASTGFTITGGTFQKLVIT
jgi:hypothetical protein